jgi:thermostable 8-oxoguanine DNA glycosylase
MVKCLPDLITLDPRSCTVEQLEAIHGVGPKTARFFLLWTGRKIRCAALDTHLLKFLRDLGYKVPKNTPSGTRYAVIEKIALAEADKRGMNPNDFDWIIWDAYSRKDRDAINKLLTNYQESIDYQI